MSSVTQSARLLELQALNALQKLELQKLNKAVDRRNKRIRSLRAVLDEFNAERDEREYQAEMDNTMKEVAAEEGSVLLHLGHAN